MVKWHFAEVNSARKGMCSWAGEVNLKYTASSSQPNLGGLHREPGEPQRLQKGAGRIAFFPRQKGAGRIAVGVCRNSQRNREPQSETPQGADSLAAGVSWDSNSRAQGVKCKTFLAIPSRAGTCNGIFLNGLYETALAQ